MKHKELIKNKWIMSIVIVGILGASPKRISVPVKVLIPAEITVPNIKILAVIDFVTGPEIDPGVGKQIANILWTNLVDNGHFRLVENWRTRETMQDYDYKGKSQLEIHQYQAIGETLGSDGILTGAIEEYSYFENEKGGKERKMITMKTGENYWGPAFTVNAITTVKINFVIIDSKTGNKIVEQTRNLADTVYTWAPIALPGSAAAPPGSFDSKFVQDELMRAVMGQKRSLEEIAKQAAFDKLPPQKVLFDQLMDSHGQQITVTIAPYTVDQTRKLIEEGNELLKIGCDYARRGQWEEAKKSWQALIKDPEASKFHPRAWYNLGIYYELNYDVINAEDCFNKAYELKDDELYLNSINWIKERKKGINKLLEQKI